MRVIITTEFEVELHPENYGLDTPTPEELLAAEKALIEEDLNEGTGYLIEELGFAAENGDFTFKSIEIKDEG